ncbi:MAG: hypothetical protein ACQEXX_01060 [Bacillota bacterium]
MDIEEKLNKQKVEQLLERKITDQEYKEILKKVLYQLQQEKERFDEQLR